MSKKRKRKREKKYILIFLTSGHFKIQTFFFFLFFPTSSLEQVAKMVLVVVAAFTISWTPYFLVSIVTQYQQVNFMVEHNYFFTMLCINMFGFLNSSINPIIYAVMSTRFRSGFASIARTLLLCSSKRNHRRRRSSVPSTGAEVSGRLAASGSASGSFEPVVGRQSMRLIVTPSPNTDGMIQRASIKTTGSNSTTTTTSTVGRKSIVHNHSNKTVQKSNGSRFLIRPFEALSNYHRK